MSVNTFLLARLKANGPVLGQVGTRVYPLVAPQGAAFPYLTYALIAGASPATPNKIVQIDCWALTYDQVRAVADAVMAPTDSGGPLEGYAGAQGKEFVNSCFKSGEQEIAEQTQDASEKPIYRVKLEFHVWISETPDKPSA